LQEILESAPAHDKLLIASAHCQLGFIARSMNDDTTEAVQHFSRAVGVASRHELSSLGLFHALYSSGALEQALAEALRYLSLRDSEEYRTMFVEGYEVGMPERCQQLMVQLREQLARRAAEKTRSSSKVRAP
jgi:hypothetical protein